MRSKTANLYSKSSYIYLSSRSYCKDLLSSTYNLIHIRDAITSYCSLIDHSVALKG